MKHKLFIIILVISSMYLLAIDPEVLLAGKNIHTTVRVRTLIVGIKNYRHAAWNNLKFPAKDAEDLYRALTKPRGIWDPSEVTFLINEKATKERFQTELIKLLKESKKGDFIIIYYVGHGFVAKNKTYLALYDTFPERPDLTGINLEFLNGWLSIYGEDASKILVLDACHASIITTGSKGGSHVFKGVSEIMEDLRGGISIMISTGSGEETHEDMDNGRFTRLFLEAIQGRAGDTDNEYITLSDVWNYLRDNISGQTPQLAGNVSMDIPLAKRKIVRTQVNSTASLGSQGFKAEIELAYWNSIKNSTDPADFQAYLNAYPNGIFSELAIIRLNKLGQGSAYGSRRNVHDDYTAHIVASSRDQRFIKYKNGVVKDQKTLLEWYVGPDTNISWYDAKKWVEGLTIAGGGWRLPKIRELRTLYRPGAGKRNIDPIFKIKKYIYIWSIPYDSKNAWLFYLGDGYSGWDERSITKYMRVFAVRSSGK